MPVETATYISDLVSTNPLSTDGLGQADDHIRLIKSALKSTFPNINGPVSLAPADLNNGSVPVGGIIAWSGTVSAIPANWHLCDGTSGTPDLRGRFIYGAASDAGVSPVKGATGGATTGSGTTSSDGSHTHATSVSSDGAHSHGGFTGFHILTTAELPPHFHFGGATVVAINASPYPAQQGGSGVSVGNPVQESGSGAGDGHSHPMATDGSHNHIITNFNNGAHTHTATVATLPPYIALAYIQRIA